MKLASNRLLSALPSTKIPSPPAVDAAMTLPRMVLPLADGGAPVSVHLDGVAGVGDRGRAGGVRADPVALDDVVVGRSAGSPARVVVAVQVDAGSGIAGDEVALAGAASPDGVAARVLEDDATDLDAQPDRPRHVRADVVAPDPDRLGAGRRVVVVDVDAVQAVGGDHVAGGRACCRRSCSARRSSWVMKTPDPVDVARSLRPAHVGAEVVAGDREAARPPEVQAVVPEAVDDQPADRARSGRQRQAVDCPRRRWSRPARPPAPRRGSRAASRRRSRRRR